MGLAPTSSRFTASRLVSFGFDHSPPGRNRTSVSRLSAKCSATELRAGKRSRRPDSNRQPFDWKSITLGHRPIAGRKIDRRRTLCQLSYICLRLGDRNCTCGLMVPNHALFVAELHPEKMPCRKAGDDPAAATPHGGPDRRDPDDQHAASESNAARSDLESKLVPDGDVKCGRVADAARCSFMG